MKTTASIFIFIVIVTTQAQLLADSPLPPPEVKEVWSPNKKFCAVMNPTPMTTTVFRVEDDGKRTKSWAMQGWFRVANLTDDGEHLVVGNGGINLLPLNVTKNEAMIEFFKRGKLISTVTLGELLKDQSNLQRTVSHYAWGNYLGLDEKGHYIVETVEGRKLAFDVPTGKRLTYEALTPAKDNTEAEKQALAAAESWLTLVDNENYADSWDAAAIDLRRAVARKDFVNSLTAARKPLGKMKSREIKSKELRANLPGAADGKYVVVQFKTVFENKKSAIETVTPMIDKDQKWRVSGYYVK
jgi:hypothetical protein